MKTLKTLTRIAVLTLLPLLLFTVAPAQDRKPDAVQRFNIRFGVRF